MVNIEELSAGVDVQVAAIEGLDEQTNWQLAGVDPVGLGVAARHCQQHCKDNKMILHFYNTKPVVGVFGEVT